MESRASMLYFVCLSCVLRDRLLREEDIRCGGGDCGKPFLNTLAGCCCSGVLIGGGLIEMQLKVPLPTRPEEVQVAAKMMR